MSERASFTPLRPDYKRDSFEDRYVKRWELEQSNVVQLRGEPDHAEWQKLPPLEPTHVADWASRDLPTLKWTVDGLIPRGCAVLVTGATKSGKTLILQHLLSCCALGKPFFGRRVERCAARGFMCEDPVDILHLRQDSILRHLGAGYMDCNGWLFLDERYGKTNWLTRYDSRNEGGLTSLWYLLSHWVITNGVRLLLIDTCRQTFFGNENSGTIVTEFIKVLNSLAELIRGNVIITHHPPAPSSGYNGKLAAGSGAWANTVRCHLNMTVPPYYNRHTGEGKGERLLQSIGSNWGPEIADIPLRWNYSEQMFTHDPGRLMIEHRTARN